MESNDKIEERLKNIELKLEIILKLLENDLKKNTEKMSNHIDFIETIYENIKNPLGYICNKVNYFSKSEDHLSLEEDKNNN